MRVLNTYLSYDLITRDIAKALDRVEKQPVVDRDTKYYLENITKVKSIEEFVNNDRLFRYAMKAHGLEDMTYAKAFMVKALKEGISDPDSFANKLTDKRYAEFVASYNFEKYGEVATSYNRAQHDVPENFATRVELASLQSGFDHYGAETGYYLTNISKVTSVDELMADNRLLSYAMAAFGLDSATETPERVREMLEGGVSDPDSPANMLADKRYANFVSAFNFVEHGELATSRDVVLTEVPKQYAAGTGLVLVRPNAAYIKAEADYYKANISKVKSIPELMANQRLLSFAMAAHGLDATIETPKRIREMLAGGIQNPQSPANLLTDKRYANFVAAFDFEQYGELATSRDGALKETPALYVGKSTVGFIKPSAEYVKAETAYYLANVSKLESIDDLMADKRLLSFALSSYGLDPVTERPELVRQMLEGGVSDPASPANKLTDKRYAGFVTAFNFMEHGEKTTTFASAQRPSIDKYMRQTLEENAGQDNEGVRLALYFERKAPTVTSFYGVLADPALAKVARTLLSLPDSFATADIDKQVQLFESRLDIEDFSDPEALSKLMTRFTSLWEVANPTATPQSLATVLFAQPAEFGVSTDLLLTMQQMKF
jgi:hypothetical protein